MTFVLPENDHRLNRIAHHWLMRARARGDAHPHYLHLLTLAGWGLDIGVNGEWPSGYRYALQMQVDLLFGWTPANAMGWILDHPDGPEPEEQEESLLVALQGAQGP